MTPPSPPRVVGVVVVTVDAHIGELDPPVIVASVFKLICVNGTGTPVDGTEACTGTDVGGITVDAIDTAGVDKLEWCL